MNKTGLFLAGLVVIGVGGWWAYGKAVPKAVTVQSPHRGPAVEAVYATGTVEPTVMIPLSPKATARLTALYADEGQSVKSGDVLAQFEDTDLSANINQLQAEVDRARKDFERKSQLVKKKYISPDAYDQAQTALATAEAALTEANAKRDFLKIFAPADGIIIQRDGEIGEVISASGDPVFYLSASASPLRISAEVDEEDVVHVKSGQKVLIQSDAFPDKVFNGTVVAVTPKGDSVSRSYRVRIGFDETDVPLMIGMTTETNIIYQQSENALLLPLTAVGGQSEVEKIENGKIVRVKPVLGIEGKDTVEIKDGIKETDRIAVPFEPNLEDGARVRIKAPQVK